MPGQGLVDTMALNDLSRKSNGGRAPQRTYLTGESMGGHVTLLGMQEFPTAFAGGLAMCPAGPELFDYYAAMSAAAEVVTGLQFHADTIQQDAAKMAELLGKPPDYTEKGRQLASIQVQVSGGPRPFAAEGLASRFLANMATSPAALVGSTTPSNRAVDTAHIKYAIEDGLGPDRRRDQFPRAAEERRSRGPQPERPLRRGRALRRQDRAAADHDARHGRSLRPDLSRADAEARRSPRPATIGCSCSASTASARTASSASPR